MAVNPTLPSDLFPEISAYVHAEGTSPIFTPPEAFKTHNQLSTVSKAWFLASRPVQYEQTDASSMAQFCRLLETLERPNSIGPHIRRLIVGDVSKKNIPYQDLTWMGDHIELHVLHRLLPRLSALRLECLDLPNSPDHRLLRRLDKSPPDLLYVFPVTVLTIRINPSTINDVSRLVDGLPTLQKLCLDGADPYSVRRFASRVPTYVQCLKLRADLESSLDMDELDDAAETDGPIPSVGEHHLQQLLYYNLSKHHASYLETTLLELARGADLVEIALPSVPDAAMREDFDLVPLGRRLYSDSNPHRVVILDEYREVFWSRGDETVMCMWSKEDEAEETLPNRSLAPLPGLVDADDWANLQGGFAMEGSSSFLVQNGAGYSQRPHMWIGDVSCFHFPPFVEAKLPSFGLLPDKSSYRDGSIGMPGANRIPVDAATNDALDL